MNPLEAKLQNDRLRNHKTDCADAHQLASSHFQNECRLETPSSDIYRKLKKMSRHYIDLDDELTVVRGRRHKPTLEALNKGMRKWLDGTANNKKNETTQEPPVQRWQKEQSFLQAWGTKELFPTTHWEMHEVSRDCFVSYLGNKYSVPFRYAGHQVKIKVTLEKQLEIFDEVECIAKHPILSGETRTHVRFEHYEGMQEAKKKERKQQNPIGLATQDSTVSTPYVEARPLAA